MFFKNSIKKNTKNVADKSDNTNPPPKVRANWNLEKLENVKKIIVIASGKGGVGKSTTAVNLARAAAKSGKNVGLLDADIYGPSIPKMMGLENSAKPEFEEGKIQPIMQDTIACMSIGFLIGDDAAIMRGAMVSKILKQITRGVNWGTADNQLDVLFIDLPPGTGDVHLSLVQGMPVAAGGGGAIIVTTPQEVATIDAKKAAEMFTKTNVPILGVIENMSYFEDPKTGNISNIFGRGGGKKLAKTINSKLIAQIPIDMKIGSSLDTGTAYHSDIYNKIISNLDL